MMDNIPNHGWFFLPMRFISIGYLPMELPKISTNLLYITGYLIFVIIAIVWASTLPIYTFDAIQMLMSVWYFDVPPVLIPSP